MGKQKARALFPTRQFSVFSTERKNVARQNLIPLTCTSYFIIFESVYISKIFRIFVSVGCKTGVFGHQDADFVFLFPIIV